MKTLAYIISAFAITVVSCDDDKHEEIEEKTETTTMKSSEAEYPEVVTSAFKADFPDAQDVEWSKEDGKFEVEFELGETEKEALYDNQGNRLETEMEIELSSLPVAVSDYISANYSSYELEEAEKVETNNGVFYEVEIENETEDVEMELLFDSEGNFLNAEQEEDED